MFYSYVRLSAQIYQTTETPPWPWQGWLRHDFWRLWVVLCALDTDTALKASSNCLYHGDCVFTLSRHSYINTVSVRPREDPQSRRPSFDKVQAFATITWLFLLLRLLTPVNADSSDNISKIQLTSAHGKCKLFSFPTHFSSSFLF